MSSRLWSKLCAVLLVAAAVPAASAADWSGYYLGGNLGYARGDSDVSTRVVDAGTYFFPSSPAAVNAIGSATLKPDGFTGGAQAGRNWKSGNAVFGIEVDLSAFRLDESRVVSGGYPCCPTLSNTISQRIETDWLFSIRPRLGVLVRSDLLLYVTAGLAATNLKYTNTFVDNPPPPPLPVGGAFLGRENGSTSQTRIGGTIGGGAEYRYASNWTVKFEYLYTDFGSVGSSGTLTSTNPLFVATPFTAVLAHSADLKTHHFRIGFNYQF